MVASHSDPRSESLQWMQYLWPMIHQFFFIPSTQATRRGKSIKFSCGPFAVEGQSRQRCPLAAEHNTAQKRDSGLAVDPNARFLTKHFQVPTTLKIIRLETPPRTTVRLRIATPSDTLTPVLHLQYHLHTSKSQLSLHNF